MRRPPMVTLAVAALLPAACTTSRPEQENLERRVTNAGLASSQLEAPTVDARPW